MKLNWIIALFGLAALNALAKDAESPAQAAGAMAPLTSIATLNVPRYMGVWYEIAKFPNRFQKMCVGNTKAEYSLKADGNVQVTNRCLLESGEMNEAIGAARQIGAADSPRLKVRFAPAWLSFIPAVWGDYWVIDIDEGYQLVAVSEPRREYLWVLSRTPKVERKAYDNLLDRLKEKGLDIHRLELTKQSS